MKNLIFLTYLLFGMMAFSENKIAIVNNQVVNDSEFSRYIDNFKNILLQSYDSVEVVMNAKERYLQPILQDARDYSAIIIANRNMHDYMMDMTDDMYRFTTSLASVIDDKQKIVFLSMDGMGHLPYQGTIASKIFITLNSQIDKYNMPYISIADYNTSHGVANLLDDFSLDRRSGYGRSMMGGSGMMSGHGMMNGNGMMNGRSRGNSNGYYEHYD